MKYSENETAVRSRIRKITEKQGLIARCQKIPNGYGDKDRRWWIADELNCLVSSEAGFFDHEALNYLNQV